MIRAHMASYPPRRAMLLQALESICPQVDRVFLVLNEYASVPDEIARMPNVEVTIPKDDLKDVGKFLHEPEPDDIVVFVDDDVHYHPNFVRRLFRYGRNLGLEKNVLGFHGSIYFEGLEHGARSRRAFNYRRALNECVCVDQMATNAMMALGRNVAPYEWMVGSQKFVDVRYARWLHDRGIASWAVSRRAGFLRPIAPDSDEHSTIYDSFTVDSPAHVIDEIRAFAGKGSRLGETFK